MTTPRRSLRSKVGRYPAALFLSPLVLAACAPIRYPSLGINGITPDNAPYVVQRVENLQSDFQSLAQDIWYGATHLAVAKGCGQATYDGEDGFATGATVTVERVTCGAGEPYESYTVTFEVGADGTEPTWEKFAARVQYQGWRDGWQTEGSRFVDATFDLDFASDGGTEPGQFNAATWRMRPAEDGHFHVSSPTLNETISLDGLQCQFAQRESSNATLNVSGCDFVLRDGIASTPLTVTTPTVFRARDSEHPYDGILRIRDAFGMETVLEAGALAGDGVLVRTYNLATSDDQVQVDLTWDELAAAQLPVSESGSTPTAWL